MRRLGPERTLERTVDPFESGHRGEGLPLPNDLLAFGVAAVGLYLAARGLVWLGGGLFFAPLIVLVLGLARHPRLMTALPFSYFSHYVVSVLGVGAMLIVSRYSEPAAIGCFAFAVYHFVGVSLRERRVHTRWSWRPYEAATQPVAYWSWVTLFTAVAAALLVGFFLVAATDRGRGVNETTGSVLDPGR